MRSASPERLGRRSRPRNGSDQADQTSQIDAVAATPTGSSWKRHRRQIRGHFSFAAWASTNIGPLSESLTVYLNEVGADPAKLVARGYDWCRQQRLEPPTPGRLERFVRSAIRSWEEETAVGTLRSLSPDVIEQCEQLLTETERVTLASLRTAPGAISVDTVLDELSKLATLRSCAGRARNEPCWQGDQTREGAIRRGTRRKRNLS